MNEPSGENYDNPASHGDAGTRLDKGGKDDRYWFEWAHRRFMEDKADRKKYDSDWESNRQYYGGNHWGHKIRPAWKARPAPNYIFANLETVIPTMTDQRPTINIVGTEEETAEQGDLMQDAVRDVFLQNEFPDVKGVYVLKDVHLYGTGISKQWFDPVQDRIVISHIDTRWFFVSGGGLDIQGAERVSVAVNRPLGAIYRDYPHLQGKVQGGAWDENLTHHAVFANKLYEQDQMSVMTDTGEMVGTGGNDGGQGGETRYATELQIWDRDKKGQVWLSIFVNGQMARRGPGPYRSGRPSKRRRLGLFPFARCLCYPLGSQFWGMSEVTQQRGPQDAINRTEAQIADYIRMVAAAYMRIPKGAHVSLKDITNRLASFIVYDGQQAPDWMPAPGCPPEFFKHVDTQKLHLDNISGVFDASRGQLPSSKASGVAIQSLQAMTAGRVGLKTRMFESYLLDVSRQVIELVKQYYQDRVVRVGKRYVWINKFKRDEQTGDPMIDPNTMKPVIENDVSDMEFDVEIGVGSTLPVDKGVRFEQAMEWRSAGAISKKGLLRRSGLSEDEVNQELEDLKAEEQEEMAKALQAEQAAQAAAPPPAAGAPPEEGGAPAAPAEEEAAPAAPEGQGMPSEDEVAALEAESGA